MPGKDPFEGVQAAAVHAMALVETQDEFRNMIAKELRPLGVVAQSIEWMEPLETYIVKIEPTAELFNVVEEVMEDGVVKFDEFEPM